MLISSFLALMLQLTTTAPSTTAAADAASPTTAPAQPAKEAWETSTPAEELQQLQGDWIVSEVQSRRSVRISSLSQSKLDLQMPKPDYQLAEIN